MFRRDVGQPWGNADVTAVIAASGGGKSHWIKARLASDPGAVVVVWDWMREYAKPGRAYSNFSALAAALAKGAPGVYAFHPAATDDKKRYALFAGFCSLVYAWGGVTVIVEELMHVTKAGWAPAPWNAVITSGRHRHLTVIATTQRPALCDKTFISGATLVRVGFLRAASDKAAMADILDVPVSEIRALHKRDWLQVDDSGGKVLDLYKKPVSKGRRAKGL